MEQFQEFLTEEKEDVNTKSMESTSATKSKGSKEEGEARIKPSKAMTAETQKGPTIRGQKRQRQRQEGFTYMSKEENATKPCDCHSMPDGCLNGDKCKYLHDPKTSEAQPEKTNAQQKAEAKAKTEANTLASVTTVALAAALAGCGGSRYAVYMSGAANHCVLDQCPLARSITLDVKQGLGFLIPNEPSVDCRKFQYQCEESRMLRASIVKGNVMHSFVSSFLEFSIL